MFLHKVEGPRSVTLPDGSVLTRADLPPANTRRWVASRKILVVRGVLYGLSSANNLYTIDTTTGLGTFVTSFAVSGSTGGAAVPPSTVVPVPASLPLLAFGIGGLGYMARRKRRSA